MSNAAENVGFEVIGCAATIQEYGRNRLRSDLRIGCGGGAAIGACSKVAGVLSTAGGCISAEQGQDSWASCVLSAGATTGATTVSWKTQDPLTALASNRRACWADGGCRTSSTEAPSPGAQTPERRPGDIVDPSPSVPGVGVPPAPRRRQCLS